MPEVHLVFLVHGLWGNVTHMEYLSRAVSQLQARSPETLVVYAAKMNEGYRTYDGIDICGYRVAREIQEQIAALNCPETGTVVTKFSIIGYSLGGLISRYALGLLYSRQFFKKQDIQLINFTTFCSPHVGVLAPGKNFAVRVFNFVCSLILGNSGRQMFLKDRIKAANGMPLIVLMSVKDSIFYKALEQFQHRSLYANIVNDKRTAWWTSGISMNDPFFDVTESNGVERFHYIHSYEPIVIDTSQPITLTSIGEPLDDEDPNSHGPGQTDPQEYYFINYWAAKLYRWLIVLINLVVIAPLWIFWFIISSVVQTMNSAFRVTRFVHQYSHQLIHDYFDVSASLTPCSSRLMASAEEKIYSTIASPVEYEHHLEQSLTDHTDTLIESVFDAIERKNTLTATVQGTPVGHPGSLTIYIHELETKNVEDIATDTEEQRELLRNCHLDIDWRQRRIISNLNDLSWKKFPIYIRDTPSTHACAIVRHKDPHFKEGESVVKHWSNEIFAFN
ncbi:AaceriAFR386Cp [[Ashbya] aceris (nom. inval.)]|nr:AaceriAFR386Cp [[Ashbya] aceris (nom. inval.)]